MSSEQRYDYSYAQFVQHDLPCLDLFSDPTLTSITDASSCNFLDNCLETSQQSGQSFSSDADTPGESRRPEMIDPTASDFEFDAFTMPRLSASREFTLLETLEETGQLAQVPGNLRSLDEELHKLDITMDQMGECERAQPSLWSTYSVLPTDQAMPSGNNMTGRAELEVPPIGPINCAHSQTSRDSVSTPTSKPAPDFMKDIDIKWSGPQKCRWRDCTSKATFHSCSALKAHIRNIHVTPLVCTHPDCSYKKPFGKGCDLKRHMATMHGAESGYECLESDCQLVFSRRDKMMEHAREKHELFKCPYNHCSTVVFSAQRESHLRDSHGRYECAIGSCEQGTKSCFTKENLERHMRTCHRITSDPMWTIIRRLSRVINEGEVVYAKSDLRPSYRNCTACLPKASSEHESHNDVGYQ